MSLVSGLSRLLGRILSSVHIDNFSPVDGDKIHRDETNMSTDKVASFATIVALSTLVTLLIYKANLHIS